MSNPIHINTEYNLQNILRTSQKSIQVPKLHAKLSLKAFAGYYLRKFKKCKKYFNSQGYKPTTVFDYVLQFRKLRKRKKKNKIALSSFVHHVSLFQKQKKKALPSSWSFEKIPPTFKLVILVIFYEEYKIRDGCDFLGNEAKESGWVRSCT